MHVANRHQTGEVEGRWTSTRGAQGRLGGALPPRPELILARTYVLEGSPVAPEGLADLRPALR